jgi:hypothetical protein
VTVALASSPVTGFLGVDQTASVLLGEGIPYFDNLSNTPVELEGSRVIDTGVTHLYQRVRGRNREHASTTK